MADAPPTLGEGFYSVMQQQQLYALQEALAASSSQSTYIAVLLAALLCTWRQLLPSGA